MNLVDAYFGDLILNLHVYIIFQFLALHNIFYF